jgi:NAD(P) transhydrogenase subunit beta
MLTLVSQIVIGAADLCAAFLFMFGLKQMSSPATVPSGIRVAGVGMIAAVAASFLYLLTVDAAARPHMAVNIGLAVTALLIGGVGAWFVGRKVAMTAMPQMVAIYNGMGGGAAGSIAAVELFGGRTQGVTQLIVTLLGGLIGAVSLSGSLVAWAKLDGVINKPLRVKGQQVFNAVLMAAAVAAGGVIVYGGIVGATPLFYPVTWICVFFAFALVFGVAMTLPIGGADMPVVISIYNAFTGLAVGLEGFVLQNPALMIAGMVVGAAGLLLTVIMAKAMNRSIANVLFTNFGTPAKAKPGAIQGSERPVEASDAAIKMRYAASVIIVPG